VVAGGEANQAIGLYEAKVPGVDVEGVAVVSVSSSLMFAPVATLAAAAAAFWSASEGACDADCPMIAWSGTMLGYCLCG
jgi:hypothetical protein